MKDSSAKVVYALTIGLTVLFAIILFLFQMPMFFPVWVAIAINMVGLAGVCCFAAISAKMRRRMEKRVLAHPLRAAIYAAVGVLLVAYIFGMYFGHTDARNVISQDGLPSWHVIGNDPDPNLSEPPNRYMVRHLHNDGWSAYRYGYNAGYNMLATQWSKNAVQNFTKAAERNDPNAQRILGNMYIEGDGVSLDPKKAIQWYRRAADAGDRKAQYALGYIYDTGEGVEENDEEAVKWYLKSAKNGWPYAQNNLGRMYWNGDGVEQDQVEAIAWGILAERAGVRYLLDATEKLDIDASIRPKAELRAKDILNEMRRRSNNPLLHTTGSRATAQHPAAGER